MSLYSGIKFSSAEGSSSAKIAKDAGGTGAPTGNSSRRTLPSFHAILHTQLTLVSTSRRFQIDSTPGIGRFLFIPQIRSPSEQAQARCCANGRYDIQCGCTGEAGCIARVEASRRGIRVARSSISGEWCWGWQGRRAGAGGTGRQSDCLGAVYDDSACAADQEG